LYKLKDVGFALGRELFFIFCGSTIVFKKELKQAEQAIPSKLLSTEDEGGDITSAVVRFDLITAIQLYIRDIDVSRPFVLSQHAFHRSTSPYLRNCFFEQHWRNFLARQGSGISFEKNRRAFYCGVRPLFLQGRADGVIRQRGRSLAFEEIDGYFIALDSNTSNGRRDKRMRFARF